MQIIKDNIEEVWKELNYQLKERYSDEQLNRFYNYVYFLHEHEEELKAAEGGISNDRAVNQMIQCGNKRIAD